MRRHCLKAAQMSFCSIVISVIAPESLRYERILSGITWNQSQQKANGRAEGMIILHRTSDYVLVNDSPVKVLEEMTTAGSRILQKKAGE